MATIKAQRKWRDKNRFVKSQLNVMARKYVHRDLQDFATRFNLNGKGEAVTFSVFITKALLQRARALFDFGQKELLVFWFLVCR